MCNYLLLLFLLRVDHDFFFDYNNCSLIARKDLRDIFDQLSVTRKSKITLNSDKSRSAPELFHIPEKRKIGELKCLISFFVLK